MTSAPCATAHSMPPMIIESEPPPLSPRTLPMSSCVSGATPFLAPSLAAPEPPTVDAVWVPWPCTSDSAPPCDPVKSWEATIRPCRSGCSASAPVSRTATFVPPPLSSSAQAWSAFTCFVERSRLAWTLRSSQIFSIFAPGSGGRVRRLGEEVRGLGLVGLEGDTVDRGQGLPLLGALGGGRRGTGPAEVVRVARDDRHGVGAGVVVAHQDQAGDVEQLLVDLAGGDRVGGLGGVDVHVLADPPGLDGGASSRPRVAAR